LILGGCAVLPDYREEPLTTADVIRHLKCEVYAAAWLYPENAWVRGWTVGFIFELQVNHLGGLDSETNTWTFPLNQGANFSVALTGGFSGQATRTERFNFKFKPSDVEKESFSCTATEPGRFAQLGGRLGIADLFERAGLTARLANVKKWQSLDYNLEFVIKKNAGLTPRFSLIPIGKEKSYTGSMKWTGSRSDTQSVKMTLTPPTEAQTCSVTETDGTEWPDPRACPQPVYIVQARAACETIKEEAVCSVALGCEWNDDSNQCTIEQPGAKKKSAKKKGKRYTSQPRTSVPSKAEEDRNNNAQILNTLNNLKIGN
jgi:hypothetical protein